MVHLDAHVVNYGGSSSGNVDIGPLAHCEFLEHEPVPVDIRIDIRVDTGLCVLDLGFGITRACRLIPAQKSLVVCAHICRAVGIFHYIYRL